MWFLELREKFKFYISDFGILHSTSVSPLINIGCFSNSAFTFSMSSASKRIKAAGIIRNICDDFSAQLNPIIDLTTI